MHRIASGLLALPLFVALLHAEAPDAPKKQEPPRKTDSLQAALQLPRWLSLSGQIRARLEMPLGADYKVDSNDAYALSRLRLNLGFKPTSWLRFTAETQDAHTYGHNTSPAPSSLSNPIDLRQLHMTLGSREDRGPLVRLGRQELAYTGGWLISVADWGNVTRVFDAALGAYSFNGGRFDAFSGSVVLTDPARMDRHKPGEHLHGGDLTLTRLPLPSAKLESFAFLRTSLAGVSELGPKGDNHLWSSGFRLTGALGRLSYAALYVRQFGSLSTDSISASGGNYMASWSFAGKRWAPRLSADFIHASGDPNAKDGRRQTFDQLYGGMHNFLGVADRLGWRNTRNVRAGLELNPSKRFKLSFDLRDLALATTADSLYLANGSKSLTNTKATSRHVGLEPDVFATFAVGKNDAMGFGLGYVIPGAFLKQTTQGKPYVFPYVFYTRKF